MDRSTDRLLSGDTAKSSGDAHAGSSDVCFHSTFEGCWSRITFPMWRVLVLVMLVYFGQSITTSVMPGLITDALSARYTSDGERLSCSSYGPGQHKPQACTDATSEAAFINGVLSAASAIVAFFVCPTLGALSDAFGRRPFFIFVSICTAIPKVSFMLFALDVVPLWVYYAGSAADIASPAISVALAYSGDVINPKHRAAAAGLVMASFSLTFLAGPFVSQLISLHATVITSVVCAGAAILWTLVMIPESITDDNRRPYTRSVLNPCANIAILLKSRLFIMLACMVTLNAVCTDGVMATILYVLMDLYTFGGTQISNFLILIGVASLVVQALLLRPVVSLIGHRATVWLGLGATLCDMVLFTTVENETLVFVQGATLLAMGQIVFPTIVSIKSINVSQQEQGLIQGALYGVQQLGSGAGPLAMSSVFKLFTNKSNSLPYFPQAPFALGAIFITVGCIISAFLPATDEHLEEDAAKFHYKRLQRAQDAAAEQEQQRASQHSPSVNHV